MFAKWISCLRVDYEIAKLPILNENNREITYKNADFHAVTRGVLPLIEIGQSSSACSFRSTIGDNEVKNTGALYSLTNKLVICLFNEKNAKTT